MDKQKTSPLDSAPRKREDLFGGNGELRFAKANVTMADLIAKKYYGGEQRFKEELDKATKYSDARLAEASGMASKYYDPIMFESGWSGSFYQPSKEMSGGKFPYVGLAGEKTRQKDLEDLEKYEKGLLGGEQLKEFVARMKENNYTPETLRAVLTEPGMGEETSLEHEVGHHPTMQVGEAGKGKYVTKVKSHMTKPTELANVVGKIQRETFKLRGSRFEDEKALMDYVKKTPLEEAIKGYSPEAQRGWRTLYENTEGYWGKPSLLEWASKIAPSLVMTEPSDILGS